MTILPATIGPIIQTHTVELLKNDTDQMIVIPLFDENGDQYTGSVTNLGVNFILNGGTDVTLSTTCVYSATAGGHKLTIPSANITALGKYSACVTGDEIGTVLLDGLVIPDFISLAAIKTQVDTAISDAGLVTKIDTVDTVVDGIATTLATPDNFKADISNLATSAEIAALNNLSEAQVLAQVASALGTYDAPTKAELDSAVATLSSITAVGAEKIVPADKYTFDASAKTLTFSSPYNTLTVEQITFIKNLTTNYIIWDCRYAGYQTLPIRFGATPSTHVLSFDSADLDAANTDKIMIVVNQV